MQTQGSPPPPTHTSPTLPPLPSPQHPEWGGDCVRYIHLEAEEHPVFTKCTQPHSLAQAQIGAGCHIVPEFHILSIFGTHRSNSHQIAIKCATLPVQFSTNHGQEELRAATYTYRTNFDAQVIGEPHLGALKPTTRSTAPEE